MKPNHNSKRHRGRSNVRRGSYGAANSIESNGPEVKIRGKASQLYEKYQTLSQDALSLGDRVASESYLQHAEHYYRVMTVQTAQNAENSNDSRSKPVRERDDKTSAAPESPEPVGDQSADGRGNSATTSTEVAAEATEEGSSEEGAPTRGNEAGSAAA